MKYIKLFITNYLSINNFFNQQSNKNIIFENKILPYKYNSFKFTKKNLLKYDLYFDIYNDNFDDNLNKKYNKFNDLTAEHIFPQSFLKYYSKAKFDMHNIYLTNSLTNNYRSNYKYYDENNYMYFIENIKYIRLPEKNYIIYNKLSNYRSNKCNLFIPCYNSRGKIARSIAYIKLNYENVILENVIEIDTLKKWNKLYPPSKNEKNRNKIIKFLQGNNNIFIENYLLVDEFFNYLQKK
tara:strand:+ start:670 stop:1383 length:714 start_codon:yes stop_codon:yes gene_type:complete